MTKRERQDALKACTDEMQAILNKPAEATVEADNSRYDELKAQATEHKAALDQLRDQERINAERRAEVGALAGAIGQFSPRTTSPPNAGTPNVTRQHNNIEDDPNCGFKTPREFLMSVMGVGQGRREDERLLPLRAAAGSDEQGEYADAYGNYVIPVGMMGGLLSVSADSDPTAGRTTSVPMSTPTVKINARSDKTHTTSVTGGLRMYRRAETDDVTASRMAMEQVTLNAHSLMGVAYATEEILTDSPISFAALIQQGFSDEVGAKLLEEKIRGTGTGEYEGVLNTPCLVTITKETGQAAATIQYENVIKMRARCWGYGNAIWLANHDTLPQLMLMNQALGTGGVPVWQPSGRDDHPDTLLGRPIFFNEFPETLGTVGDLILGNWSQYLEGTLEGSRSAESMHVRFLNHERTFKFWTRNDGRVWWRSAITPRKGSSTLSPFVVLGTRS